MDDTHLLGYKLTSTFQNIEASNINQTNTITSPLVFFAINKLGYPSKFVNG